MGRALNVLFMKVEELVGLPVQIHPGMRTSIDVRSEFTMVMDQKPLHLLSVVCELKCFTLPVTQFMNSCDSIGLHWIINLSGY